VRIYSCLFACALCGLGVSDEELLTYIPQCLRDDIKADFFYTTLANVRTTNSVHVGLTVLNPQTLKLEPYPVFIQEICNTLQVGDI
jgi:hypothetical protein